MGVLCTRAGDSSKRIYQLGRGEEGGEGNPTRDAQPVGGHLAPVAISGCNLRLVKTIRTTQTEPLSLMGPWGPDNSCSGTCHDCTVRMGPPTWVYRFTTCISILPDMPSHYQQQAVITRVLLQGLSSGFGLVPSVSQRQIPM
jgi:hypothetical protein